MSIDRDRLIEVLKTVKDPELDRDIVALGMLKNVQVEGGNITIQLEAASLSPGLKVSIEKEIKNKIQELDGISALNIEFLKKTSQAPGMRPQNAIKGVKHVIAVASGKGGVGKSTVSVNLSLALSKLGHKVGLMDGDIYGPNIPLMLGVSHDTRPTIDAEEKITPIEAQGIRMISMGVLVPPEEPMVWRGPMLHSAMTQFLQKVSWGELDYLIVDLPPGTGDVQLSLVQSVPLSGAVIVTTPQEVALMDVRKGIAMFHKTNVPILGVIENMAGEVFGEGGGEKAAKQFDVPFLGCIPLDTQIRVGGDAGKPIVTTAADHKTSQKFMQAAKVLVSNVNQASHSV